MHSLCATVSRSLIGLLLFALPASVGAETTVPQHRLSYSNLTVVRDNPEGLQDDFKLDYRYALFRDNPGLLFQECEVLAGTTTYLTPAKGTKYVSTAGMTPAQKKRHESERDEKSKQQMMAEFAAVADAYDSDEDMGASSGGYGTSYD